MQVVPFEALLQKRPSVTTMQSVTKILYRHHGREPKACIILSYSLHPSGNGNVYGYQGRNKDNTNVNKAAQHKQQHEAGLLDCIVKLICCLSFVFQLS